jgi:hypothetical protein
MDEVPFGASDGLLEIISQLNTTEDARVAEFIDNSLASYFYHLNKTKKLSKSHHLKINLKIQLREISIHDNAGGINDKELQRALMAGIKPTYQKGLNEFGLGMKIGAFFFTRRWSILTKAIGENERKGIVIDLDKINSNQNIQSKAPIQRTRVSYGTKSGTTIKLGNLKNPIDKKTKEKIKIKIISRYRKFIKQNKISIYFNDEKLKYEEPQVRYKENFIELKNWELNDRKGKKPKKLKWERKIKFKFGTSKGNENKYSVSGVIGILEKEGTSRKANGLFYFRKGRCVREHIFPENIFGISKSSNRYKRTFADLDFSDNVPISPDKSKFNLRSEDEEDFELKLLKELKDPKLNIHQESDRTLDSYDELARQRDIKNKKDNEFREQNREVDIQGGATVLGKQSSDKINPIKTEEKPELINHTLPYKIGNNRYKYTLKSFRSKNLQTKPFVTYEKAPDYSLKQRHYLNLSSQLVREYLSVNIKNDSGVKLLALYLVQSAVFLIEEEKFTERGFKKFFNLMNKIMLELPPTID